MLTLAIEGYHVDHSSCFFLGLLLLGLLVELTLQASTSQMLGPLPVVRYDVHQPCCQRRTQDIPNYVIQSGISARNIVLVQLVTYAVERGDYESQPGLFQRGAVGSSGEGAY